MTTFSPADTLHRLVKQALDSGAAASLEEAEKLFNGYRLTFTIGPNEAQLCSHQIALLTGVALARRVFLGGVIVTGALDAPLTVPLPLGTTLGEAVKSLGAGVQLAAQTDGPVVSIGGEPQPRQGGFHVRISFAGWRGGIVQAHAPPAFAAGQVMPLAPMLAAALAVNEAFLFVRKEAPAAGRRAVGLSLWQPGSDCDWRCDASDEPALRLLPSRLWLLGLGHLGQAYLWGLGLLPYAEPSELMLVLQDIDVATPSTVGTSILTQTEHVGQRKTRAIVNGGDKLCQIAA